MILLLGAPRSGTSWLGKILDSHPDVLYRHEPDTIARSDLPFLPEPEEVEALVPAARAYLDRLAGVRHPKVAGSQPQFAKSYRPAPAAALHRLAVAAGKGLELAGARLGLPLTPAIPDLAGRLPDGSAPRLVIKSVSSLGRALLFARARPDATIVHILRHPCAQIASRLRGARLKVMDTATYVRSLAATTQARRLGFDLAALEALSLEEQMAAQWAILNQKVADELGEAPGCVPLDYDAFCTAPEPGARALLARLGLGWPEPTRAFVAASSTGDAPGYFSLMRRSLAETGKWRHELTQEQTGRILAIARRAPVGQRYAAPPAPAAPSQPERVAS
jgi:hypothetical protein